LRDNYKAIDTEYKTTKENAQSLRDTLYKEELSKVQAEVRGYEKYPQTRKAMDDVIEHASITIPQGDKIDVINNPQNLVIYIDKELSGYNKLTPKVQRAVEKEIANSFSREVGHVAPEVNDAINKTVDQKINSVIKEYESKLSSIKDEGKRVADHPDFRHYKEFIKPDDIKVSELKKEIESVENNYESSILKAKEYHQSDLLATLGEGQEFGKYSINATEVFGKEHLSDLKDFFRISKEEASDILNKSGLLETHINSKFHFTNASRIIKNKLGSKVNKLFIDPLRQAEHNYVNESVQAKEYWKEVQKDFNAKERKEIGIYLLSQQEQALKTFDINNQKVLNKLYPEGYEKASPEQRAAIKADLIEKYKDKLIVPKKWEELSQSQRDAITDIKEKIDVVFYKDK
jgi:hypothetical protein